MKGKKPHSKKERIFISGERVVRLDEGQATRLMMREVRRQTDELCLVDLRQLPSSAAICVFGHRMETAMNNISATLRRQDLQAPKGRLQLMLFGVSAQQVQQITGADYGEYGGVTEFSGYVWHDLTLQVGQMEVQLMVCEDEMLSADHAASLIDVPQERLIGLLDRDGLLTWIVSRRSQSWLSSSVMVTTTPARVLNHHEDGEFVDAPLLELARQLEGEDQHATIIIHEGLLYTQATWDAHRRAMDEARQQHEQEQEQLRAEQKRSGAWRYSYFTMTPEERAKPRARRSRGAFIAENAGEIRQREHFEKLAALELELADMHLQLPDEDAEDSLPDLHFQTDEEVLLNL